MMWFAAAAALLVGAGVCLTGSLRGDAGDRLVALELAGIFVTLALLTLAQAYGRGLYVDVAMLVALVSFPSGLVFTRFPERWTTR